MDDKLQEGLQNLGLVNLGSVFRNLNTPVLYEEIVRRHEAKVSHLGPIVLKTGRYTGRLPKDKFIVSDSETQETIGWGSVNRPMSPEVLTV